MLDYIIGGVHVEDHEQLRQQGYKALHLAVYNLNYYAMEILLGRRIYVEVGWPDSPFAWLRHHNPQATRFKSWWSGASSDTDCPPEQDIVLPEIARFKFDENGEGTMFRVCDVDAVNTRGETALHLAARSALPIFIETLLQEGANVNALDLDGRAPLHRLGMALNANGLDLRLSAQLLCEAGADLTIEDKNGTMAIQGALLAGTRFVQQMDDLGFSVSTRTRDRDTVLHLAVRDGASLTFVEILLEAGSDVHAVNDRGDTSLHLAVAGGAGPTLVKVLLEAGSDVHARNHQGETALHLAAGNKDPRATIVHAAYEKRSRYYCHNKQRKYSFSLRHYQCEHP